MIKKYYGSKNGFVKTNYFNFLNLFGTYNKYKKNNYEIVNRLVFVCKGNICRSAFAELVAKDLGFPAISCGIEAIEGAPANTMATKVAKKLGYDLEQHQSQPIKKIGLTHTDLLVAMEPSQGEYLNKTLSDTINISLLGLWKKKAFPYIHDPYGNNAEYFEQCFLRLIESVKALVDEISKTKSN